MKQSTFSDSPESPVNAMPGNNPTGPDNFLNKINNILSTINVAADTVDHAAVTIDKAKNPSRYQPNQQSNQGFQFQPQDGINLKTLGWGAAGVLALAITVKLLR